MGIIRGKIWHPKLINHSIHVGGTWPLHRCKKCDEWINSDTGEHLKTLTLKELLDQYEIIKDSECPKD